MSRKELTSIATQAAELRDGAWYGLMRFLNKCGIGKFIYLSDDEYLLKNLGELCYQFRLGYEEIYPDRKLAIMILGNEKDKLIFQVGQSGLTYNFNKAYELLFNFSEGAIDMSDLQLCSEYQLVS